MNRNYFETLQLRVDAALEAGGEKMDMLTKYKACVAVLQEDIQSMRSDLEAYPFEDNAAEVRYYKHEAPRVFGLLFFYLKLERIEAARQYLSREKFLEQLRKELQQADTFQDEHAAFCQYYFQRGTYADDYLFTRRGYGEWSVEEIGAFIAEDFTLGAWLASWIHLYERLTNWLSAAIEELERLSIQPIYKKLPCTAKPVEVVELFKGLHLAGCFPHTSFRELMDFVRDTLGVDVHNYTTILQDIAIRKKIKTKFLDHAREELIAWIDERS